MRRISRTDGKARSIDVKGGSDAWGQNAQAPCAHSPLSVELNWEGKSKR